MRRTAFVLPPALALILWGYALAEAPTAAPILPSRTVYAAPAPDDYLAAPTPQPSPPTGPDISDLVPAKYRALVIETARRYNLDPRLLAAVGWVESRWRKGASGSAGEIGLLQILPSTADWIAARMGLERYDLADPATNLNMAAWYLRHTIDAEGSVERGLAAYNGGPRAWDRKPLSKGLRGPGEGSTETVEEVPAVTITIPAWLLWIVGGVAAVACLFFAVIGFVFFWGLKDGLWR